MKRSLRKVADEKFPVKAKLGGGLIKIEAWEDSYEHKIRLDLEISCSYEFMFSIFYHYHQKSLSYF